MFMGLTRECENLTMSNTSVRLAELRKSYERAELSEDASHADPLQQFDHWMSEAIAAEVTEPNAMTLATVASNLRPSTRVVLIKGYDERGLVWFTNYDSRKGQELAGIPFAALQFHWVELERVVRIEGRVEKTSAEESDAYFATRPLDSRIGAWASPQSQPIPSRTALVATAAKYSAQFLLNSGSTTFCQGGSVTLTAPAGYTIDCDTGWSRARGCASGWRLEPADCTACASAYVALV